MDKQTVMINLTEIFKRVMGLKDLQLDDKTTAEDVPEWDSLAHIQLIVESEKFFGIKYTAKEILTYQNVGQFCESVIMKINNAKN